VTDTSDALVARLRAAGCVFAEQEAEILRVAGDSAAEREDMIVRRVAGEPLEHVVGWAAFCEVRVAVEPGVFVPRHRSALLAGRAADLAALVDRAVVVDLCCGTGAIGAVVRARVPAVELHAADVDPAAVRCARRTLGTGATVHEGDLDAPLPADLRGRVDVLVASTPYVPRDAIALMPPEARDHEPRRALDGGNDGLDVIRRLAAVAPGWLRPGGHLLVETAESQSLAARAALTDAGLTADVERDDDLDATVVLGRL
jgi:release factor glutamine methyltransferase